MSPVNAIGWTIIGIFVAIALGFAVLLIVWLVVTDKEMRKPLLALGVFLAVLFGALAMTKWEG